MKMTHYFDLRYRMPINAETSAQCIDVLSRALQRLHGHMAFRPGFNAIDLPESTQGCGRHTGGVLRVFGAGRDAADKAREHVLGDVRIAEMLRASRVAEAAESGAWVILRRHHVPSRKHTNVGRRERAIREARELPCLNLISGPNSETPRKVNLYVQRKFVDQIDTSKAGIPGGYGLSSAGSEVYLPHF